MPNAPPRSPGRTPPTIFEAITSREELGSTGLGNGIAIPHGKIAGLGGVTAVFARLETPIDFERSTTSRSIS